MTPDLWKALIGAVVGLLLAITALVKVYTNMAVLTTEVKNLTRMILREKE